MTMAPRPVVPLGIVCLGMLLASPGAGNIVEQLQVKFRIGLDVILQCPVGTSSGFPSASDLCPSVDAIWFKENHGRLEAVITRPRVLNDPDPNNRSWWITHGRNLSFFSLEAQDEGNYECQIQCGHRNITGRVKLVLINQMEFVSPALTIDGVTGDNSTLPCFSSGPAGPTRPPRCVTWYKNYPDLKLATWDGADFAVFPSHRRWLRFPGVKGNWSLEFTSVEMEDAGLYSCEVQWADTREEVTVVRLTVVPVCRIVLPNQKIERVKGASVLFLAQTTAPICRLKNLTWIKDSYMDRNLQKTYAFPIASFNINILTQVHPAYQGRAKLNNGNFSNFSLSIENLRSNDDGSYTVRAFWDSDQGELLSEAKQYLSVYDGCDVQSPRGPVSSTPRGTVMLPCHARSQLCELETIQWVKNAEKRVILTHSKTGRNYTGPGYEGRVRLAGSGPHDASLILTETSFSDSGIYLCEHRFKNGSSSVDVTLQVNHMITGSTASATPKAENPAKAHVVYIVPVMLVCVVVLLSVAWKKKRKLICASNCRAQRTPAEAMENDAGDVVYAAVTVCDKHTSNSSHQTSCTIDNSEHVTYSTIAIGPSRTRP